MPAFMTVRDAARLTGRSPSSIRRIIYRIIRDDAHPERDQIRPSVDEVGKLRLEGENFAWKLSEDLLRRELPVEPAADKTAADRSASVPSAESELIAMLRRELEIKNQQIAQQHELFTHHMAIMDGLSERLHEGNVLIGSLQQRLALTDGRAPAPETAKPSPPAKKGSTMPSKSAKPKKGFFARFFR